MSTEDVNAKEDTDMAECEEEKVVTMMDVLQEQQEFEDDANAVLGASDDKNCTFTKGYVKRQAIYACLTCCAEAKIDPTKRAGVCLACSLSCHENHELIELYTKRNFRCDCGNPKFNGHPCQFVSEKLEMNEENQYNQNFSGLYCTCHRPYPDPEASFEDEMIQCVICEDWLHAAHLETNLPTSEYAEMVCKACMEKNEFLHDYSDIAANTETEDVDVLSVNVIDTLVVNNSAFSGVIEKVNGAIDEDYKTDENAGTSIAIGKVESVATDNNKNAEKSEEVANTSAENKLNITTPEQANSGDKNERSNVETSIRDKSNGVDQPSGKAKSDENVENDSPSISSIIDSSRETKTYNVDATKESDENKNKEIASAENQIDTDDKNNDNSIIESIEKLENELGNIVPEEKIEETKVSEPTTSDTNSKVEEKYKDHPSCLTAAESGHSIVPDASSNRELDSIEKNKEEHVESKVSKVEMNEAINSETVDSETRISDNSVEKDIISETIKKKNNEEITSILNGSEENTIKRKFASEHSEDVTSKKPKLDKNCARPIDAKRKFKGATFWPSHFRQKLCTCSECIAMYNDLSVLFLIDSEDTVTAYETLGKEKVDGTPTSQYERGLKALSSLDRIQQINALTEYNKMRDKLLDFLKSFKERKEIVKEEDIKAFFAGMKPKRESDGVYFCR